MEHRLLGYLLQAETPDELRETEKLLAEDALARTHLSRLRLALAPLKLDMSQEEVPPELFMRTIARVAEHIVEQQHSTRNTAPTTPVSDILKAVARDTRHWPVTPSEVESPRFLRRNVFVFAALSLLLLGMLIPSILAMRTNAQATACKDNLRAYYAALSGYADVQNGNFPRVEEDQQAVSFVTRLQESGQLGDAFRPTCPASGRGGAWTTSGGEPITEKAPYLLDYAYTLGWRGEQNHLVGLRNNEDQPLPLLSDAPLTMDLRGGDKVTSYHGDGVHLLLTNGTVQHCSKATVGPSSDHIFCNQKGIVRAGLNHLDAVLARGEDRP